VELKGTGTSATYNPEYRDNSGYERFGGGEGVNQRKRSVTEHLGC
jgi:hypothetical protein